MTRFNDTLDRLAAVIEARRGADQGSSWSARLIADPALAAKKLAEEAIETDLIYHWLALLAATGVTLDDVAAVLEAREGRSGIAEKASRA
jgi:phosphoribosyl-ATP pyrophosphohydrolase